MEDVCHQDMEPASYEEMRKAVLLGDAMDTQLLGLLRRWPATFHIAMIPDFKLQVLDLPMDDEEKELLEAQNLAWRSKLQVFEHELKADQKLLERTKLGSAALADILDWNASQHARQQQELADSLVGQFMAQHFPKVVGSSWSDVPGAFSLAMSALPVRGATRCIAYLDFNAPHARDTLRLPHIASSIASVFKNIGPENCVVLAIMAAQPRVDSGIDPLEDEIAIRNVFLKAGFEEQQRIRGLLQHPSGLDITLQYGDYHLDGRLMYLGSEEAVLGKVAGDPTTLFAHLTCYSAPRPLLEDLIGFRPGARNGCRSTPQAGQALPEVARDARGGQPAVTPSSD